MLKQVLHLLFPYTGYPAAFRRLCVETAAQTKLWKDKAPAAFRRLCVETVIKFRDTGEILQPPSGGCVLKPASKQRNANTGGPAAFRRLCVETLTKPKPRWKRNPAAFRRLCVETLKPYIHAAAGAIVC